MQTTVFRNGGSQAIRIPAEYRFSSDRVEIHWDERLGALIIREAPAHRMDAFFEWILAQPKGRSVANPPLTAEGRLDVAAYMDMDEDVA